MQPEKWQIGSPTRCLALASVRMPHLSSPWSTLIKQLSHWGSQSKAWGYSSRKGVNVLSDVLSETHHGKGPALRREMQNERSKPTAAF